MADMDIFGLMPMTDPLHLVCCNACKKPVKASQYAAHAEICRSLTSAGEMLLDTSGGIGHRRPPRKERKKLLSSYSNQATPAGEQGRSESMNADDPAALESQLHRQPGLSSSFSIDAKNVASMMDSKGVSPESIDHSACALPPPTKRIKLVSRQRLPLSDDCETAPGLKKTTSTQIALTCKSRPILLKLVPIPLVHLSRI
uniref:Uncharacterized protein MANES_03G190800 n=1 Tax=Rhizophora mucronata TaxID=61149 RepID=A0A2P2KPZ5_RHIMU